MRSPVADDVRAAASAAASAGDGDGAPRSEDGNGDDGAADGRGAGAVLSSSGVSAVAVWKRERVCVLKMRWRARVACLILQCVACLLQISCESTNLVGITSM